MKINLGFFDYHLDKQSLATFRIKDVFTLVGEDVGQGPARLNEVGAWDLLRPDRRDLNPKSERLLCPAGFSLIEPTDPSLLVNKTRLINILKVLTLKAATEKI